MGGRDRIAKLVGNSIDSIQYQFIHHSHDMNRIFLLKLKDSFFYTENVIRKEIPSNIADA